jgi:hypothetical protein
MLVKAKVFPVSASRGFSRSGEGHNKTGQVCVPLPAGLRDSDRLPAIFTPTKAESGHDETFPKNRQEGYRRGELSGLKELTLSIYGSAVEYALKPALSSAI